MGTWRTNNKALGLIEETQQSVITDGTLNKQGEEIIKLEIKTHPTLNRSIEMKGNRKIQERFMLLIGNTKSIKE